MDIPKYVRKAGWAAFMVMWVPFITLFIGMIGLPSGEYAWSELPALSRISLVLIGVFGGTAVTMLVAAPVSAAVLRRRILQRGRVAGARVLSIWDTGTTINYSPVVRLLLEVDPPDQPAFQAETEQLISRVRIPRVQPGARVRVAYDPRTLAVALLDEDEAGAATP